MTVSSASTKAPLSRLSDAGSLRPILHTCSSTATARHHFLVPSPQAPVSSWYIGASASSTVAHVASSAHSSAALSREKDIMDAFHSVVLAFAAQWSPHWISGLAGKANLHAAGPQLSKASENKVRLALWECARDKLQKVANLDSFRVIFALIIFAWTEKPREVLDRAANDPDIDLNSDNCALNTSSWQSPAEGSTFLLVAACANSSASSSRSKARSVAAFSPWNAPASKSKPSASASPNLDQASSLNDVAAFSGPGTQNGTEFEPSEKHKMARQIQSDLESRRQSTDDNTVHTAGSMDRTAKASQTR
ncbi:hypothetical protein L1887_50718 [Cichorium endivia]|nr:hypothetical protein L1887_50718 [Cichorium endivia]